jgi:hypothetical protein
MLSLCSAVGFEVIESRDVVDDRLPGDIVRLSSTHHH